MPNPNELERVAIKEQHSISDRETVNALRRATWGLLRDISKTRSEAVMLELVERHVKAVKLALGEL